MLLILGIALYFTLEKNQIGHALSYYGLTQPRLVIMNLFLDHSMLILDQTHYVIISIFLAKDEANYHHFVSLSEFYYQLWVQWLHSIIDGTSFFVINDISIIFCKVPFILDVGNLFNYLLGIPHGIRYLFGSYSSIPL